MKSLSHAVLILSLAATELTMTAFADNDQRSTDGISRPVQLLTDPGFANGFNLLGTRSIETGSQVFDVLDYGRASGKTPAWRLAQWGTRHSLQGAKVQVLRPGVFQYANKAKSVIADTVRGELTLRANASQEYIHPRKPNEEWPHLLVEQYLSQKPPLSDLQELRAKFKVALTHFHDAMTTASFDPGLHAAQLQLYLMVQNSDTSSTTYGDYLWFGMALFDNREEIPKETWHKDGGKEDTTHKFIYIMPSSAFLNKKLSLGQEVRIDIDVLPYIWKAFDLARQQGFLSGTSREQLAVSSINFGWELPGTFDAESRLRDFELLAIPK